MAIGINIKKKFYYMTKVLNNANCSHHLPEKYSEKALFAKIICNSYSEAVALLKGRNLGPGEIAVVRYYVDSSADEWSNSTGMPIRMVMGIGGANAQDDDDVFVFNDDRIQSGGTSISKEELIDFINVSLANYYTKAEIDKKFQEDDNFETIVVNRLDNIDGDIDELRKDIKNIQNADIDLSNYYTKEEINKLFNEIEIPDINLDQYYTKSEITEILETTYVTEETLLSELENKADVDDINEITEKLETKVDSSYVENYFETNVENTVNQIIQDTDIPNIVEEEIANQNINQQVSDAVDEKLKDFEGVTTDTLDEALQNNEYFTTNVITPITQLETTVKELVNSSDNSIDGGEEEW